MALSIPTYHRLLTREVRIGNLLLGNGHPVRIQTMTTTDTMDTTATVAQTIRCIEAGAELVRITAPSIKEAHNLEAIKKEVRAAGYDTPLVADIHFTPNAAEVAARLIEKVRVNPGNYADKKKFDTIDYTDAQYEAEIERIRNRFVPLVRICKEYGTAMRIGTNHGSLSDRIMSRYGDTAIGMVESALEFLRIARDENYHQIVLSMKSSNPIVMIDAYRLLVQHMQDEFGTCYPLHLGVTEAGDGEDGRIKSAIGIGTLLREGIGDTIRVSLTEEPELELPVCRDLVKIVPPAQEETPYKLYTGAFVAPTHAVGNIGGGQLPVVVADLMHEKEILPTTLSSIGYDYDEALDKWHISDAAADFIYTGKQSLNFKLPGTLRMLMDYEAWQALPQREEAIPLLSPDAWEAAVLQGSACFISLELDARFLEQEARLQQLKKMSGHTNIVLCVYATGSERLAAVRSFFALLASWQWHCPVIICVESYKTTVDEQLIDFSVHAGAPLLEGMGQGIWLMNDPGAIQNARVSGRTYLPQKDNLQFLNNTAFSVLQATRRRISKTEYISCPSCGRTLFDLQETTAKIRNATQHLKGLKIAVMGCIVNGPGEMADADFGYVGSGPGKITLYKGKEVVQRNVPSEIAVDALIDLLKANGVWIEPAGVAMKMMGS